MHGKRRKEVGDRKEMEGRKEDKVEFKERKMKKEEMR